MPVPFGYISLNNISPALGITFNDGELDISDTDLLLTPVFTIKVNCPVMALPLLSAPPSYLKSFIVIETVFAVVIAKFVNFIT